MQKLSKRKTYTPTDTSLVCGNCGPWLNRDESPSVTGFKTSDNNLEVNPPEHVRGLKADYVCNVYVISKTGLPLMPCGPAKARRLLKQGKAKIIRHNPFTIRLNFECENQVQGIILGIDSGAKKIGFSAVTNKKELISGELILDDKTSKRIKSRKMYRQSRRNHKWYRPARFLNRNGQELPPSIRRKYQTHLNLIKEIHRLLPITQTIVETGNFDIQKIENPGISGVEYQRGELYQYHNRIAYLIAREHGKCQLCGKNYEKGKGWRLHHIWSKDKDRPQDWALLHESCHKKLHANGDEAVLRKKKSKSYKEAAFMNIIRKRFWRDIPGVATIYGYETFCKRNGLGLVKTHTNDAFVIAGGDNQDRCSEYQIIQKRRNNRVLQINRKGFKPSIRRKRSPIQSGDLFWVDGRKYICEGMFSYGKYIWYNDTKKKKFFNTKRIMHVFHTNTLLFYPRSKDINFLDKEVL